MNEASKTFALLSADEKSILQRGGGGGIDIGCGSDPITPSALAFDIHSGDANTIKQHLPEGKQFDFVFSSHCLEHMFDPIACLQDWWSLVKSGGSMILVVPDEDLYEQGYFPSFFNSDHKHTFTISKQQSWSPVSVNLLNEVQNLPNKESFTIELMDQGYDHNKKAFRTIPWKWARRLHNQRVRISKHSTIITKLLERIFVFFRLPIDQTVYDCVAQIKVVITKA